MIPASRNEKTLQDSITSEEKIKLIINYLVNKLDSFRGIYKNPFNKLKLKSLQDYTDKQLNVASILNGYWHTKYNCKINSTQKIEKFSSYIMLSKETPEYILNVLAMTNNEAREKLTNTSKVVLILEEMNETDFDRLRAKKEILGETSNFEIKEKYINNKKIVTLRIITKLIELSLSDYLYNVDTETWANFSNISYGKRPKCEVSIIRKDGLIIPNDKVQQIIYKNTDKNKELITELDSLMLKYANKILYIIENSKDKNGLSINAIYEELMKDNISDKNLLNYIAGDEIEQLKELEKSTDEAATAIKESLNAIINRCKEVIEKGNTINVKLQT